MNGAQRERKMAIPEAIEDWENLVEEGIYIAPYITLDRYIRMTAL